MKDSNTSTQTMPKMLRAKQVAECLGVHVKTVWLWVKEGRLSRPVRLGARCSAWRKEDIEAFIDRCEQESRG